MKERDINVGQRASFLRRGAAFGFDLAFLVAVSIPFIFLLTLTLSYINPKKYENPVHQVQDALKAHKSIHMEFGFLVKPKEKGKEEKPKQEENPKQEEKKHPEAPKKGKEDTAQ